MSKEIFNVKFNGVSRSSKHVGLKDEHLNPSKTSIIHNVVWKITDHRKLRPLT